MKTVYAYLPQKDPLLFQACRLGFEGAVPLDVGTLRFMPEVRAMCESNRCGNYGKCWVCPPACGDVEALAARAASFKCGLLVQTVGKLSGSFDYEGMMRLEHKHKRRFARLARKLSRRFPTTMPLGAGGCRICKTCAYPGAPCRHPNKAFVSMEAAGLLVSEICERNGLPYTYGENSLAYTSCILF